MKIITQIKTKNLILFDDMIADMLNNKKLNPIVIELFITGRKLNITHFLTFKLYILFYYKNSKQTKTSRNCIY